MSDFDTLCKNLEAISPDTILDRIVSLSDKIISALLKITDSEEDVVALYQNFILATVSADGKLAPEEFSVLGPFFNALAGREVSFDEITDLIIEAGFGDPEHLKEIGDAMVSIVNSLDEELRDDIITLCLLICAVDSEVSDEEKAWIRQLSQSPRATSGGMAKVDEILTQAGTFVLSTVDGNRPRSRILGLKIPMDGKIWFAVGTHKEVYSQLVSNPACEILASVGSLFLRWNGVAEFSDDQRLALAAAKAMPQVAEMYLKNGWQLAFFTIGKGSAEIVDVSGSKTVLF